MLRRVTDRPVLPPERREVLRRAALAAHRDGGGRGPRPGLWPQLVEGTWTIVDSFDFGGRWLVIARRND
ncbi:MAG TPA: hypothetical protein VL172_20450, partial [Kofleriaceae bacterium]|nr:hypothetical protein [Kofleriaceae bacterium]